MRRLPKSLQIRKARAYGLRAKLAAPPATHVPPGQVRKAKVHVERAAHGVKHELKAKLKAKVDEVLPLAKKLRAQGMTVREAVQAALRQVKTSGMSGCGGDCGGICCR